MDTTIDPSRICCVCNKELEGRSDKVFCGIKCKNTFYADMRKHTKIMLEKLEYKPVRKPGLGYLEGGNCYDA